MCPAVSFRSASAFLLCVCINQEFQEKPPLCSGWPVNSSSEYELCRDYLSWPRDQGVWVIVFRRVNERMKGSVSKPCITNMNLKQEKSSVAVEHVSKRNVEETVGSEYF